MPQPRAPKCSTLEVGRKVLSTMLSPSMTSTGSSPAKRCGHPQGLGDSSVTVPVGVQKLSIPQLVAVSQQTEELSGDRHQHDVGDTRDHEGLDGVVDHRAVVDGRRCSSVMRLVVSRVPVPPARITPLNARCLSLASPSASEAISFSHQITSWTCEGGVRLRLTARPVYLSAPGHRSQPTVKAVDDVRALLFYPHARPTTWPGPRLGRSVRIGKRCPTSKLPGVNSTGVGPQRGRRRRRAVPRWTPPR